MACNVRPRTHYAGRILNNSFISPVRPNVHTNPARKPSFSEMLFKPKEFENDGFSFSKDGKHFENGAFWKRWHNDENVISLPEFSSTTNPKWQVIVAFSNSSGVMWTENIWCVFRVKPPFSNSSAGLVWTGYGLVLQFFIPSFSTRVLFQVGVSLCSSAHEDALYAPDQFPQDQLNKPNW